MTVIRQELLSVVQLEECSLKIASVVLGFVLITFLCSLADLYELSNLQMKYCVHSFSKKLFLFDTKKHLLKIIKQFVQNSALMVTDDFHECSAWPCFTSWELYCYVCALIFLIFVLFLLAEGKSILWKFSLRKRTPRFPTLVTDEALLWASVIMCIWTWV